MGTMTISECETADWALARARVDAQLRAYRVIDHDVRARLTAEILAETARRHEIEPGRRPEDLAAEETFRRFNAWIDALLGPTDENPAVRFARGRAAIHLADLPGNWPELMFAPLDVPDDLLASVRTVYLEAGPDLTFANMGPRPIDLGPISSVANGTWRTFARWPVLRGAFIAGLFFSLLGMAFYLVRF